MNKLVRGVGARQIIKQNRAYSYSKGRPRKKKYDVLLQNLIRSTHAFVLSLPVSTVDCVVFLLKNVFVVYGFVLFVLCVCGDLQRFAFFCVCFNVFGLASAAFLRLHLHGPACQTQA